MAPSPTRALKGWPDVPEEPHLFLRADAGLRLGNGHVMRCLALADAWKELGGQATFLVNSDNAALHARVCRAGHGLELIPASYPHSEDAAQTICAIRSSDAEWLVLDGYHFDGEYHAAIREAGCRLLVIDDNAHLPCYEADVLLNQNLHAPELAYEFRGACRPL